MIVDAPVASRAGAFWFQVWQWIFGVGIAAGLVTATLGFVLQIRVVGAITLACALLGMIACRLGLAAVRPTPPPRARPARDMVHRPGYAARPAYRNHLDAAQLDVAHSP